MKAAAKKAAEEAATKNDAEEAAKAAGEVDKDTEVSDLNETASEEEECSSTRLTNDRNAQKHLCDWPLPEWFCEALGTSLGTRSFHGNVKFLISDPLSRYMSQMLYAGQSGREIVTFLSDF